MDPATIAPESPPLPAPKPSANPPRSGFRSQAPGLAIAAGLAVAVATLAHDRVFHHHAQAASPGAASANAPKGPGAEAREGRPDVDPTTTVVLPEGKFRTAEIRVEPIAQVELPKEYAVAGKVEADPNRRIALHARAPGVVRTVPALPGTRVKAGQPLVVLDSAEVGSARLLLRQRQRALAITRIDADRRARIAANVEAMIDRLRKGATAKELARQFDDKPLGNARGTIISAWAELELAAHEFEKQSELNKRNIIGEHPVFLAEHTREGAQARFESALDSIRFEVHQADRVGRQMVRDDEEAVVDAVQRLRVLGVSEDVGELLAHPERASEGAAGSEDLTAYPIVAPFDGTVVSTTTTRGQRVDLADPLFVLADLSVVHAVASVPESDFSALPALSGARVKVLATAYPGREFAAKVLYAAADVDPTTRTVRLVAEVPNPDDALKLGMFARVVLDTASTEKAVTVPAPAIVEIDGKPAVFVPGPSDRTFVRRDVQLGREALGRRVVTDGLKPGDRVVVAGAFLIKSELILQNETEEE